MQEIDHGNIKNYNFILHWDLLYKPVTVFQIVKISGAFNIGSLELFIIVIYKHKLIKNVTILDSINL